MPKKLPKMTEEEINQLMNEQFLCRIVFMGKETPYIAPFQYALVDGQLYFHFTDYGKKIGLLKEDNPVCVEIEKYTQDLREYRFVVLAGKLKTVTGPQERALAINKMAETAKTRKLSNNFLAAHGFPSDKGWSVLTSDKPLIIVKLAEMTEKTGLQSP